MSTEAPNKGVEIVQELYKAPLLPPYRLQAIQDLKRRIADTLRISGEIYTKAPPPTDPDYQSYVVRLHLHRSLAMRWKRYLSCYFYERWRRVRGLHWRFGRHLQDNAKQHFSQYEKNGLDDYEKLLITYVRNSGIEVTTSMTPPTVVYVEVDVLEDVGQVTLDCGAMLLMRGSRHLLKRRDVEHMIAAGFLREVSQEIKEG